MGQTVELEGATGAINPGEQVVIPAGESTQIAEPHGRKVFYLFNFEGSANVYLRFAADGAGEETGLPIPPNEGFIVRQYSGPLSVFCSEEATLFIAEF